MHTRPFWLSQGKAFLGRSKQAGEKEKTGKGKKINRKRKDQEQEGEAREAESVFLMTKSVRQNLQKFKAYSMPLAKSPKRLTLICSKYHGIVSAMTNW